MNVSAICDSFCTKEINRLTPLWKSSSLIENSISKVAEGLAPSLQFEALLLGIKCREWLVYLYSRFFDNWTWSLWCVCDILNSKNNNLFNTKSGESFVLWVNMSIFIFSFLEHFRLSFDFVNNSSVFFLYLRIFNLEENSTYILPIWTKVVLNNATFTDCQFEY